jgi:hypothetical protein
MIKKSGLGDLEALKSEKKSGLDGSLLFDNSKNFQKPPERIEPQTPTISQKITTPKENTPTSEVPHFGSTALPNIRSYEVPHFKSMKRLDIRLTKEQKRFLEDLEDQIREEMPEGESENPKSRRITKASIVRVMVEFFRQMNTPIDASIFKNENDLLDEWVKKLTIQQQEK